MKLALLRPRRSSFLIALALALTPIGAVAQNSADGPGATANALRQVYSGTLVDGPAQVTGDLANTESTPSDAEPLTMQTVNAWDETYEPTVGITRDGTVFSIAKPTGRVLNHNIVIRSDDDGVTWRSMQPTLPGPLQHEPVTSSTRTSTSTTPPTACSTWSSTSAARIC